MSTIGMRERQERTRDVVRSFELGLSSAVLIDGRPVARVLPRAAGVLVRRYSGRIPGNFSQRSLTCGSNTCTIAPCP